ncbi:MAG: hypothetical protein ACYTFD_20215 [Planctomycetota bacterium]|jgi:hypothetical protein
MRRAWILAAALTACASTAATDALYFDDPPSAVPAITKLLEAKDWQTLARYYDLEGSNLERADLESGAFFYTDQRPESAHPAGFWRYKHPFAPGFTYLESRDLEPVGLVEVVVAIEIDQGAGSPPQRGLESFLMRRSPAGYQILPGEAPTR